MDLKSAHVTYAKHQHLHLNYFNVTNNTDHKNNLCESKNFCFTLQAALRLEKS